MFTGANPRLGINLSAGAGLAETGTVVLSAGGGVTFGMQTNAGGSLIVTASAFTGPAILSISAGTTRVTSGTAQFSNSNGISFGASGVTITAAVPQVSYWDNRAWHSKVWNSTATAGLWFQRLRFDLGIAATRADMIASSGATLLELLPMAYTLGTWAITPGEYLFGVQGSSLGIYTMTGSTANLASSGALSSGTGASFFMGAGLGVGNESVPGGGLLSAFFAPGRFSSLSITALPSVVQLSEINQTDAGGQGMPIPYLQLAGTF